MRASAFRTLVLNHWRQHGRHDLPWRRQVTPYRVLVSEYMLQQTQVPRVIEKFRTFLRTFPSFRRLAAARPAAVIAAWQGLGYNRRALMLHRCAQAMVRDQKGTVPRDPQLLQRLPGIGPYTAAAVSVFAFDVPHPLIETNVRRVYLYHFFPGKKNVSDTKILPLVARDVQAVLSPRIWFSALMDYGTWLAGQVPNPNRRSRHYTRQGRFEGSVRQLRGQVLRVLVAGAQTQTQLAAQFTDHRLSEVLRGLEQEGFVVCRNGRYRCA